MKTQILTFIFITLSFGAWAQEIYTVAGNGAAYFQGDGMQATESGIIPNGPVAFDADGNMYIADMYNNRIRKVDAVTGIITTVAGNGVGDYNGDGIPATTAQIHYPMSVALDNDGNIYIGDYSNNRIRKVDATSGLISTIAGTGTYGYTGDSLVATTSMIKSTTGIAVDNSGDVYFNDFGNSRIRKINVSDGKLYNIAGTGSAGYNGDNIPAIQAQISQAFSVTLDASGNIFFADEGNNRIRRIDAVTGIITTVAGSGVYDAFNGDSIPALTANFRNPMSVAVNSSGDLFIADEENGMIRKVDFNSGLIYTVAGTLTGGQTSDGISALSTLLLYPRGVTTDDCGNIYISEYGTKKVRKVFSFDLNLSKTNTICYGQCNGTISLDPEGGIPPYSYSWSNGLGDSSTVSGLCAGTYKVIVTDNSGCTEMLHVTITEPSELTADISTVNATCNANGSAHVSGITGYSPFEYLWSDGNTTATATGLCAGTYTVTITDAHGCTVVKSATIINSPAPFPSAPICMVTVDSLSQNNIIIWNKAGFENADKFIVSREISANNYQPIAEIPYTGLSMFVDTVRNLYYPNTGDPNSGTYRYKLQVLDTCGNHSNFSPYHNTIFILNNGSGIFYWTQPYTIENGSDPVSSYELMRDDSSNGNWQVVASVAGTQQTVSDPLYAIYEDIASWRVRTVWGVVCTPSFKDATALYSTSFSNIYTNNTFGINNPALDNQIFVYPNPTSDKLYINSNSQSINSFDIYNIMGEIVISGKKSDLENNFIDLSDISKGLYFINLKTFEGVFVKKIIKN